LASWGVFLIRRASVTYARASGILTA
jgi:hypothetical protein